MINIGEQENLLLEIGKKLEHEMTVYAIGGTAMMLQGTKEATKDIDIVFENEEDRLEFRKILEEIGYAYFDPIKVYGSKAHRPMMLTRGDVRLDLFNEKIISFTFSDKMKERAKEVHEFGKLKIRVTDPGDIIILKCATDREKDLDDAVTIIRESRIFWKKIIEEAKNQVKLGKISTVLDLGEFLEKLQNNAEVPAEVLDELFEIVKEQIDIKQKSS